jgi:hypothetical protein
MRSIGYCLAGLLLAACATDGLEDYENDRFTSGKADGYELTEAEALAVMKLAGAPEATLREAGVASRAAANIAKYVAGKDGRRGTADDQTFDSLEELDGIAYVGPHTLDALLAAADVDPKALGRHDVSVLVPLPTSGDLPWTAAMPGRGGAVLPKTVFAQIGRSVFNAVDDAAEYDALRIVGVRFDPCFTTSLTSACQPQIRLVLQALDADQGTSDGAVHALYNLSAADFVDVTARLRAMSPPQNRTYTRLGVSPALQAQGMTGEYATALGKLIADYCGPATLARMTFVTRTNSRQGQWELGGFHVQAFSATGFPAPGPIKIAGETLQVINNAGFGVSFRYGITPAPIDAVGSTGLDGTAIGSLSATQKTQLSAWAFKQEAPVLSVPDTTDCASCHIAGHVSNALEAVDPKFATLDRGPRAIGEMEDAGDNLRAFGYFFKAPMVSIRTANETAAVLRALAASR